MLNTRLVVRLHSSVVNKINGQGTQVKINGDRIDISSLILEINASQVTISADVIDINGIVTALQALTVTVSYLNVTNGIDCGDIECGAVNGTSLDTNGGAVYCGDLDADSITAGGSSHSISWKSQGVIATIGVTSIKKNFKLADDSSWNHDVVTAVGHTSATINYLGY